MNVPTSAITLGRKYRASNHSFRIASLSIEPAVSGGKRLCTILEAESIVSVISVASGSAVAALRNLGQKTSESMASER